MLRSVMPMISAAWLHVNCPLIARVMTSLIFIARSKARTGYITASTLNLQCGCDRTPTLPFRPDISFATKTGHFYLLLTFFWKGPSASEKRRREIICPCASNFQFQLSKHPAQPVSWRCRSHGSLDERFCPHRECGHPSRRKKSSGEEILWHSARRKTVQPFYPNRPEWDSRARAIARIGGWSRP